MQSARIRYWRRLLLPLLLLGMSGAALAAPQNIITLATGEWPPYTTANPLPGMDNAPSARGYGIAVDIIDKVLKEMSYTPQLEFMDWPETLQKVEDGSVRAAFPFVMSDERKAFAFYSDPLMKITSVMFYNIDKLQHRGDYKRYSDLAKCRDDCRVGLVTGYVYPEEIKNNIDNPIMIRNERDAFSKLISGEINMLPADRRVAQELLYRYFSTQRHQIAVLPDLEGIEWDVHLLAGRQNPENEAFIQHFNRALDKLRKEGEIERIIARHRREGRLISEVRLTTPSSYPLIFGTLNSNTDNKSSKGLLVPPGTRAVVVNWHPSFQKPMELNLQQQMREKSLVEIMEGPLRGQLLWVPNIFISFE